MGKKIIAEDSEDEEDMSIRSSTITMDMLEKAEDQFWEESIDTGEGSYDDFDSDGSDLEKEDDDDGLGEGTVLLRRKRRKNTSNSNNKTNEESRATRTLENSILRARQFASMENARKIVQEGEKARVVARSTLAQSSERAAEISKQAVEKAEFVRRQIEAVPNKKEIVSAAAAATAATAAISTVLAEPLMTMAGSIVAFSLVKSFETMDEQLRQKQKEIETKKREEKVDLLMKTKERKVETRVEVVDAPLEVVSAVTSSTPPVEEQVKTREDKKIVEKEEEILGAAAAAATTTQQATTTPRSRTATNSATSGFVSQIANENETALFEARKKREQILNEMAQYNDAPATTKNGNTMRPGKLAETTNNKYFANRATKRTADVLGYSTTPPQNVPTDAQKEQQPKASTTSPSPSSSEKKKRDDDTKISLFAAFFAVFTFPFTLLLELFRACVEVLKKYFFSSSSGEERDAGERS